jgi:hypothetical protein
LDDFEIARSDDWDGRGAPAIQDDVLRLAENIVQTYGGSEHIVEVTPGRDGSLSFVWDEGGNYIYIDVGPGDTVHLFYDLNGMKWEGVSTSRDLRLKTQLRRAFARYTPRVQTFVWKTDTSNFAYSQQAA